jgi:hypothetical protein
MKNSNLCNKYRHNTVFHDDQNKNLKFDDFKANIARQLQLFSMHLYRFVLLVHTFA